MDDGTDTSGPRPTLSRSSRAFWLVLAAILLAGLGVRVYGVLGYRPPCKGNTACTGREFRVWGDSFFYQLQANALADGKGFVDPVRLEFSHLTQPSAGHPPMYGTYLAAWSLLGARTATWHRLASALLGTGTIAVLALLARRLAGNHAGLITAALAAFFPGLWANDYMLLSETMAAFTVALALFASFEFARDPTRRRAIVLGVALGFAALSRSEIVLLFALVAIPLTIRVVVSWRDRVKTLGVVFLAGLVVLGPWVGYNLARFKDPTFLSTGLGSTISAGSCDVAWYGQYTGWYLCGYQEHAGATTVTNVANGQIGPVLPLSMDESERDVVVGRYARTYVRQHLSRLPIVVAARVGRLWYLFKPRQTAYLDGALEGRGATAARLARWTEYLVMIFGTAGIVVLWRRRTTIVPIIAVLAASTFAAAMTFGIPRYRVSADVGLVLASGIALDAIWRWVRRRGEVPREPLEQGA